MDRQGWNDSVTYPVPLRIELHAGDKLVATVANVSLWTAVLKEVIKLQQQMDGVPAPSEGAGK